MHQNPQIDDSRFLLASSGSWKGNSILLTKQARAQPGYSLWLLPAYRIRKCGVGRIQPLHPAFRQTPQSLIVLLVRAQKACQSPVRSPVIAG